MAEKEEFHYNDKYHCNINIHRGIAVGVNKERTVYTETSGGDGHIHTGLDGKVRGKINPITTTSTHDIPVAEIQTINRNPNQH